ncbi:MAG: VWA domain-containing protein [Acidobacteriota bacterium]|jgi:Ca-activated chloride channel family protein
MDLAGQSLRLAQPWALLALAVLPVLVARYMARQRRGLPALRYSSLRVAAPLLRSARLRWRHLPFVLRVVAIALLVGGLARPQSVDREDEILTRGIDIIVSVDNSTSMAAEDLKPNRLEAAKAVVDHFIQGRRNDRIGMVVFAGRSYPRCPLTLDYEILQTLLDGVQLATKEEDGTAIGMGLANAVNRLRDGKGKSRVVILLTDGRNNQGQIDPATAADLARSLGVKVYTIGVGTSGEAPYPYEDPVFGRRYVMLRVDLDEKTLRDIAERTGGQYFRATDVERLQEIFAEIDAMETTDVVMKRYERFEELYLYLVGPAGLLLLLEQLLLAFGFRRLP